MLRISHKQRWIYWNLVVGVYQWCLVRFSERLIFYKCVCFNAHASTGHRVLCTLSHRVRIPTLVHWLSLLYLCCLADISILVGVARATLVETTSTASTCCLPPQIVGRVEWRPWLGGGWSKGFTLGLRVGEWAASLGAYSLRQVSV